MTGARAFPEPRINGPFDGTLILGTKFKKPKKTWNFSIYDAGGAPLPDTALSSTVMNTRPDPEPAFPDAPKAIEGPVLFAGIAESQFGHVLTNALGRLWALDQLPAGAALLYTARPQYNVNRLSHLRPVLAEFGVTAPVHIVNTACHVPEVYTASDLYGEAHDGLGAPAFFDWLNTRLPPAGETGGAIYVTRARLGDDYGRFACETHLETLLQDAGYEVFAPEEHDLATQIATFRKADRLIFAEGSALHLYYLIARPGQTAAVILRRRSLPPLISTQLANLPTGGAVAEIEVLRDIFWPPRLSDHLSVGFLDFDRLRDRLVALDLLSADAAWQAPTAEQEKLSGEAGLKPGEKLLTEAEWRDHLAHFLRNHSWPGARRRKA